jgi:hypothetical protein
MATPQNNTLLKWIALGILFFIGVSILMMISMPLVEKERIFSNIFVDSYKPRKVLIIEKAPIRIMFFGEAEDTNATDLVSLIQALDKTKFIPGYRLNPITEINVDSRLVGDRNRNSSHVLTNEQENSNQYQRRSYNFRSVGGPSIRSHNYEGDERD